MKRAGARRARLAVSVGCPSGIGPEVSLLGALGVPGTLLIGDYGVIQRAAEVHGVDANRVVRVDDPEQAFSWPSGRKRRELPVFVWQPTAPLRASDARPGRPGVRAGAAQLAWVDAACDLASRGAADAMVTGPVSKAVIVRAGGRAARRFRGHTEHLQERLGAREVVMAFVAEALTTALVTTHLALADVPRAITAESVATGAYWLGALVSDLARSDGRAPKPIAVAALNPHAGEGGLFGDEERRAIAPGIARARRRLAKSGRAIELAGPVPAETAFRHAVSGRYDAVLAMYHDQATIPSKLSGFGEAVNVSLGLPIVRTSVDHGTAYDIALTGAADPRGMGEALALAARLARARKLTRDQSTWTETSS